MLSFFKWAYGGAGLSQLHLGVLHVRCSQRRPGRHSGLNAQWLREGADAVLPSDPLHHECEPQGATTPARVFRVGCRELCLGQRELHVYISSSSPTPTQGSSMGRVRCSFSRRRVRWSKGCQHHPRWCQKSMTNMTKTRAKRTFSISFHSLDLRN